MAIYPKATSELNIFNDDDGDAISPPDLMINSGTGENSASFRGRQKGVVVHWGGWKK